MTFLWGVLLGLAVVFFLASLAWGMDRRYDWLWYAGMVCTFAAVLEWAVWSLS